jgi:hypothetical protein
LQRDPKLKALLSAFSAFTTEYLADSQPEANEDEADSDDNNDVASIQDGEDEVNIFVNGGSFKRIGGGLLGSHDRLLLKIIQDFTLIFFANLIVSTGCDWVVWGLMVCSLLSPPSLSLGSHLALTLVLPLVIVVGSYAGFGNFDNNSGSFTLLLVIVYWWLVHLLPLLGHHVLSLFFAPPWSGHIDSTKYCQGHTIHKFSQHHCCFGGMVTYPTHVIVLSLSLSLLSVAPPHPIEELIQNKRHSVVDLHHDISSHHHEKLTANWEQCVSSHLSSDMCRAPPIVVHAYLLSVVLHWCKPLLIYICGWCKTSIPCCQCMPYDLNRFSWRSDTCEWNVTVNNLLLTHDPSC